jgi:RNA-binding protein 39
LPPLRPNIPGLPAGVNKDTNAEAEIPYYRLYVGNLYYNLTADDIRQVFEPFGELAFVDLPMEPQVNLTNCSGCPKRRRLTSPFCVKTNRSRGYAFVQYKELEPAKVALGAMNGFELAGRSSE